MKKRGFINWRGSKSAFDAATTKDEKADSKKQAYSRIFLQRSLNPERTQCYISRETHDKICRFLPVIAPRTPITSYVDTILRNHFEQYKELINELYEQESKKPLQL